MSEQQMMTPTLTPVQLAHGYTLLAKKDPTGTSPCHVTELHTWLCIHADALLVMAQVYVALGLDESWRVGAVVAAIQQRSVAEAERDLLRAVEQAVRGVARCLDCDVSWSMSHEGGCVFGQPLAALDAGRATQKF